jgi:nonsense-mediated mRNA decay protein 3
LILTQVILARSVLEGKNLGIILFRTSDVSEGMSLENDINQCRTCERWEGPPWMTIGRESNEMLTMLLKKINGLNKKVKLMDAKMVWTEPHSKRIKVKLKVSKEVMTNTIMQKEFIVTFTEHNLQCDECRKSFTPHLWNTVVQLRQKVSHKRTFLFLEQLILKHKAHEKCLNVEEKGKFGCN